MKMNKEFYIINARVPICPKCKAGLKFSKPLFTYFCHDCKMEYSIVDEGQTEHEFKVKCIYMPRVGLDIFERLHKI